jgi:hypothetical protein
MDSKTASICESVYPLVGTQPSTPATIELANGWVMVYYLNTSNPYLFYKTGGV